MTVYRKLSPSSSPSILIPLPLYKSCHRARLDEEKSVCENKLSHRTPIEGCLRGFSGYNEASVMTQS